VLIAALSSRLEKDTKRLDNWLFRPIREASGKGCDLERLPRTRGHSVEHAEAANQVLVACATRRDSVCRIVANSVNSTGF
jgi:hypothetical protein